MRHETDPVVSSSSGRLMIGNYPGWLNLPPHKNGTLFCINASYRDLDTPICREHYSEYSDAVRSILVIV